MVGRQSFVRRGWHGREVVSSEVASNGGGGASDVGEHGEVVALLHDMHSHDRYMPRPLEFPLRLGHTQNAPLNGRYFAPADRHFPGAYWHAFRPRHENTACARARTPSVGAASASRGLAMREKEGAVR